MVYRRETYRGPVEKTVAAWTARVTERISQVNDDGQVEHVTALVLTKRAPDVDAASAERGVRR